jgi:hypothetical protein
MRYMNFAVVCGLLAIPASGQNQSSCPKCANTTGASQAMTFTVPGRTFQVSGDVLKINLNGIAGAKSWHLGVGVKPGSASNARINAALFEMGSSGHGGIPASNARSFPEGQIAIGEAIEVWMPAETTGQHTVFYVELPRPMTLELTSDHQLVARVPVAESVYFSNGKLMPEQLRGFGPLLFRAMFGPPKSVAGVQRVAPDEYAVAPPELVKNLSQFSQPPRYEADLPKDGTWVSFLVAIGAKGDVTEISYRGDARLREHCRPVLLGWRFRPFQYNGSTVTVKSTIRMTVDSTGNISIPMLETH